MSQALGFAENILTELESLNPENYPGQKVTQPGFLASLLTNQTRPNMIESQGYVNGHRVPQVNISYMRRSTPAQWQTNIDCGIDASPAFRETSQTINQVASINLFFAEDTIRQYGQESSRIVNSNQTGVPMMSHIAKSIFTQLQGGYRKINSTLLTSMSTKIGKNVRGGLTTTAINFNDDGTTNSFAENIGRLATDLELNEICGPTWMIGSGNPHVFFKQHGFRALSANQSGLNNAAIVDGLGAKFMYDPDAATVLGANRLLVAAENSVHFLEYNKHVGAFAGEKGAIVDFQIVDPFMQCWNNGAMTPFRWDVTLRYNDCDTSYAGYAGTATYGKGWHVIISKTYDLFVTPTDAYDGGDIIAGQNGTLLYEITNT